MLSIISSTIVSATSTSALSASAISMTTHIGLPEYGVLTAITLILLLCAKEILSDSHQWDKTTNCSLNMGIFALISSFAGVVAFNLYNIII
jgi:hypothetical protein